MKIGAMNNPMQNLMRQIQWIGENKFDFVDLTLEPPGALAAKVNVDAVRDLLDKYNLDVIGHTAYYLPIASPFPSFCELAIEELRNCFVIFQMLDAKKVNLHADEFTAGMFSSYTTLITGATGDGRVDRNPVSRPDTIHYVTGFYNHTGTFMTRC